MGYWQFRVIGKNHDEQFEHELYSGKSYRKALRCINKNRNKFDVLTLEIRDKQSN